MSALAITAESLSKQYRVGQRQFYGDTLRDAFVNAVRAPFQRAADRARDEDRNLWALRDVSFEVREGEVLGIIGRNGAGKSTLLKILSRVTEPTRGRAIVRGQVGSLLEVGTGFHPDLTGRDNIYLNGSILGMSRQYIESQFDEIVAFAEVEKFLDTPVKHYSSGMRVRLAFAVAAHFQPEILVIDEVLAVGDAKFQERCLGKMDSVARSGRTILFVSHHMASVRKLCSRCLWIDAGRIAMDGPTGETVNAYLRPSVDDERPAVIDLRQWSNRYGLGMMAHLLRARLLDASGAPSTVLHRTEPATIEFDVSVETPHPLRLDVTVVSESGDNVLFLSHYDTPDVLPRGVEGRYRVSATIPSLPLAAGNYHLRLGIQTERQHELDVVDDVLPFRVEEPVDSPRPFRTTMRHGFCSVSSDWALQPLVDEQQEVS
ncbi:MAG TPA: ABC transporter ATP-binding protein [Gemmatimonadaceae bacterium]|nr:ABC transporter ATP-binding protein [Gemmatimonadaceae bacterium]